MHAVDGLPITLDDQKTAAGPDAMGVHGWMGLPEAEGAVGRWLRDLLAGRTETADVSFPAQTGGHTMLLRRHPVWDTSDQHAAQCFRFPGSFNFGDTRFQADAEFRVHKYVSESNTFDVAARGLALRYTPAPANGDGQDAEGVLLPRGVHRCSAVLTAMSCTVMPQAELLSLAGHWHWADPRGTLDPRMAVASSSRLVAAVYNDAPGIVHATGIPSRAPILLAGCGADTLDPISLVIAYRATWGRHFAFERLRIFPATKLLIRHSVRMAIPASSSPWSPSDITSRFCTQLRDTLHNLDLTSPHLPPLSLSLFDDPAK